MRALADVMDTSATELRTLQTKNVSKASNGTLSGVVTVGPLSAPHQYGLKSVTAASALSIPLTGFLPLTTPSVPNLTDCGFTPTSLILSNPQPNSPSVFAAALNAAMHSAFSTDIAHIRAKSCQPLGRLSNLSDETITSWPPVQTQNDDKPLDLTVTTLREFVDSNAHTESTTTYASHCAPKTAPLETGSVVSAWDNLCSTQNIIERRNRTVQGMPKVHGPHVHLASTRYTVHTSHSTRLSDQGSRHRRSNAVKPNKPFDQPTGECEPASKRPTRPTNKLRRSVSTEEHTEKATTLSDAEGYCISSHRTLPVSMPASETQKRRSRSAYDSKTTGSSEEEVELVGHPTISSNEARVQPQAPQQTCTLSAASENVNCVYNPRMRRFPEMTPKEIKDAAYWEKRVRNNEAARRSRRARKTKEATLREYAEKLEKANAKLVEEINLLRQEVHKLKSCQKEKTI